ncbi:calcium/sodium antiporter [Balneolales bacterium ANBcel1]|nr:calcium/sodium antiporter [Balneolales bacterium ANBcel1]
MIVDLIFTLAGIFLLYLGAELLVNGSIAISKRLGISPMLIGMVVIGLGTSSPELVVSLQAALIGSGEVAVGNIVGSNISNIALILGIAALIVPIGVERSVIRIEVPVLIAASLFMGYLLFDGMITRLNGLLLLACLAGYLLMAIRSHTAPVFSEETESRLEKFRTHWLLAGSLAGILLLVAGAHTMITGALGLASIFQISDTVIGLTLVAVGTSLPELATAISASLRKQGDLIIGGLIGSNILNVLFVLGITSAVSPLEIAGITWGDLALMSLLAIVLWPVCRTGYVVSRTEGGLLLLLYAGYMIWVLVR